MAPRSGGAAAKWRPGQVAPLSSRAAVKSPGGAAPAGPETCRAKSPWALLNAWAEPLHDHVTTGRQLLRVLILVVIVLAALALLTLALLTAVGTF